MIIAGAVPSGVLRADDAPTKSVYEAMSIFDPEAEQHGHVHASSVIECPNGDLRAVWYENGPALPSPPFYNKDRDKSADVRIAGSRKKRDADKWERSVVMSDTFGVADNNPSLAIDAEHRLWLIHSTMLGAPDWTWGSSVLRYRISSNYDEGTLPRWEQSNILIPHPQGLEPVVSRLAEYLQKEGSRFGLGAERLNKYVDTLKERLKDPLKQRLGWMPRVHPLVRHDGALMVPLSNENFDIAMMAITSNGGETWTYSHPVPNAGVIQPSLVELPDGTIQAYFRNSDPRHRIQRSVSKDGGLTWSPLELTDLLHPGGGIEAVLLKSGRLAIVYNNKETGPRDKLAVSISDDLGKTWKWTRQLEDEPNGRFDYPSVIQAQDGMLNVTYSYHLKTIKHVRFNEAWVQESTAPPTSKSK